MDVGAELRALEESLLDPQVRRDRKQVSALLTEDFREFGSSGRIFDRERILAELETEDSYIWPTISDFEARVLAPGVVLVTYKTGEGTPVPRPSLRTSIWVMRNGRWQILFHQGTRIP